MIVRRCAYDHDIVIHKNNKPNMVKTIELSDGTLTTITYPNAYNYFLVVDGEIVKKSNSFSTIENAYVDKCAEMHDDGHGCIDITKHKLVNNKVVGR
tara:strand:- start:3207 stop:3497 length:291 start_codon:yes stop_codon:yes gene_type:complete